MRTALCLSLLLAGPACNRSDESDTSPADTDTDTDVGTDAQAPVVAITSPADGAILTGSRTVTVSGTIDADAPVTAVTVTGGNADVEATFDDSSFLAELELADGDNTITVTVTAGETGEDAVTVRFPFVTLSSFEPAVLALGQPDFTSYALEPGPVTVGYPTGHGVWTDGTLYLSSSEYNRVLGFRGFPARNGEPADLVLGQPDFSSTAAGSGASGMVYPETAEVAGGRLYVLDWVGSRLMGWSALPTATGTPADFAVGQTDVALTSPVLGCSRATTNHPDDFTIADGKLYLSDSDNHRVLIWNTVPTASGTLPDVVLGQSDFDHCAANDDDQDGSADAGPTSRTLKTPRGLWSDGTRLFVADYDNYRVSVWNTLPTSSFAPADFVLGQPDATTAEQGTSADQMAGPNGVAGNGNQIAVTDGRNHRALVWNTIPSAPAPADVVLGQSSFAHNQQNDDDGDGVPDAGPTGRTLFAAAGIAFVRDMLMVSDTANSRVLVYGVLPCPPGEYEPAGAIGTCEDDPCQPDPCTDGAVCRNDSGSAVCE